MRRSVSPQLWHDQRENGQRLRSAVLWHSWSYLCGHDGPAFHRGKQHHGDLRRTEEANHGYAWGFVCFVLHVWLSVLCRHVCHCDDNTLLSLRKSSSSGYALTSLLGLLMISGGREGRGRRGRWGGGDLVVEHQACDQVTVWSTLRAPLSGTFLQTLPDLVTSLKGQHSLSRGQCPPKGLGTNVTVEAT